jgi:outer membrane protein assembly factor BamB
MIRSPDARHVPPLFVKRLFSLAKRAWQHDPKGMVVTIAAILVAAGAGLFETYNALKRPPDVRKGEEVAFTPPEQEKKATVKLTDWRFFGNDPARTRYLAAKGVNPPYKKLWKYGERPLLEFPPVYAKGRLYAIDNNAFAFSLDADTGKILWKRRIGKLNASAPAYANRRLYLVNLVPGQALALNAKTGRVEWRKQLPGRSESSPVVVGNRVYFGCETGELFAVDRRNGHTIWTAQLGGAIKAGPAYDHGILYVGDYGGTMSAVNAHTGNIKWQSSSQGLSLGRTGAFYSTPAVAFGRVYSGNNDGRVYSFSTRDGTLAWSHSTGSYVYSGPTVADTSHSKPTVYIGSFDGYVYALDAKTGDSRWTQPAGGSVIGSLSAVGNIVYVAEFEDTTTTGFAMKNGRKVFQYGTGAYTPVISDGHRIYLTGYSSITALEPFKPGAKKKAKKKAKKQAKKNGKRQRGKNRNRPGQGK